MLVKANITEEPADPVVIRGFDSYDFRLGDVLRGERATLGKSLLDVQRELRIKASYIAAIEDSDISVFESTGFIAGYVRSYARYLNLDQEWVYECFCEESGFKGVTRSFETAMPKKNKPVVKPLHTQSELVQFGSNSHYQDMGSGIFDRFEPRVLGSFAILMSLIVGLSYGGWTLLREFQRVNVTPLQVNQTLDSTFTHASTTQTQSIENTVYQAPPSDNNEWLYNEKPTFTFTQLSSRDAPISTIEPGTVGALATVDKSEYAVINQQTDLTSPNMISAPKSEITLLAVRPAWIRVSAEDGSVIHEQIMDSGQTYPIPANEKEQHWLHAGNAGSVYFLIDGIPYGPVGSGATVSKDIQLSLDKLKSAFAPADLETNEDLATSVALLSTTEDISSINTN